MISIQQISTLFHIHRLISKKKQQEKKVTNKVFMLKSRKLLAVELPATRRFGIIYFDYFYGIDIETLYGA